MWIFQKNSTLRDILLAVVSSSTGTSLVTQKCRRELIALRLETTLSTSTLAVSWESKFLVSTPSLSLLVSWMSLSKIFLTFWSVWSSRERWEKTSNNKPLFDDCRVSLIDNWWSRVAFNHTDVSLSIKLISTGSCDSNVVGNVKDNHPGLSDWLIDW